jgi:hypothetical protein
MIAIREAADQPGGVTRDYRTTRDRLCNDTSRAHNGVALDVSHDDRSLADPGVCADVDLLCSAPIERREPSIETEVMLSTSTQDADTTCQLTAITHACPADSDPFPDVYTAADLSATVVNLSQETNFAIERAAIQSKKVKTFTYIISWQAWE